MAKKETAQLENSISKLQKEIEILETKENKAKEKLTRGNDRYDRAVKEYTTLKNILSKKAENLRKIIKSWLHVSAGLKRNRDEKRQLLISRRQALSTLQQELELLRYRLTSEAGEIDEIISNVFGLNSTVVDASNNRDAYVSDHVYRKLFDQHGNLHSQITLTSSDGLRRIVAMVNHITKVQSDIAAEALLEIDKFYARFEKQVHMDDQVRALFSLLANLLIEKKSFKVGPDLYKFISLEINEEVFQELKRAQILLRRSLRSEKTTSYIKIYMRASDKGKWTPVRQS